MYNRFFTGIAVCVLFIQCNLGAMDNGAVNMVAFTKTVQNSGQFITSCIVPDKYHELILKVSGGNGYAYGKYLSGNKKDKVEKFIITGNYKYPINAIGTFGDNSEPQRKFKELLDRFDGLNEKQNQAAK